MGKIIKDSDNTIRITVQDANGDPIDLAGFAGYIVEVFQVNIPFDQFSKNAQPDFRTVNEIDPTNGVFEIYLNADNTRAGIVDKEIFYELKTQAVNINFDGGTEEKVVRGSLGKLGDAETKDQKFA